VRVLVVVQGNSTRSPSSTILPSLHEYPGCMPDIISATGTTARAGQQAAQACFLCPGVPAPSPARDVSGTAESAMN
jgi:hypothetical protein